MSLTPRCGWLTTFLVAASATAAFAAGENNDLDKIPNVLIAPPPTPTPSPTSPQASAFTGTFYAEEAPALFSHRDDLAVPFPTSLGPNWINRVFFDARAEWRLLPDVTTTYSGRFNIQAEGDLDFPTQGSFRNDFREGFITWAARGETFLDAGRINVRNGVAYGFNPTDFFKTRSVVDEISDDPRVLRENRLGTVMARGQQVFAEGSVFLLYAPRFEKPSAVNPTNPAAFNGNFDHTNADDRFLLKGNYDILPDFSPEFLVYHQGNRSQLGVNITRGVSEQTTVYLEWAGGRRKSLIDDATAYGIKTGSLPSTVRPLLPGNDSESFQNDLSTGITYTTPTKLTLTLEYEYHQAGFSRRDWKNWFAIGAIPHQSPGVTAELWYLRLYALDQQEPLSEHRMFFRAEWDDAFVRNLTLTAFSSIDLYDGSVLVQTTADYRLSDHWTVGLLGESSLGSTRSDFGSNPQAALFQVSLSLYF